MDGLTPADRLTAGELTTRLLGSGHRLWEAGSPGIVVSPGPEARITLAVDADPTLKADARRPYYVCPPAAGAILDGSPCPEPVRRRWLEIVWRLGDGPARDLLAGPATWALARLAPLGPLLVWTDGGKMTDRGYAEQACRSIEAELGAEVDFAPWRTHLVEGSTPGAHRLDTAGPGFAATFAAYFLLASSHYTQIYLADEPCGQVYEVHHHDTLTASIPDPVRREAVLADLRSRPDLYLDDSDFSTSWDVDVDDAEGEA